MDCTLKFVRSWWPVDVDKASSDADFTRVLLQVNHVPQKPPFFFATPPPHSILLTSLPGRGADGSRPNRRSAASVMQSSQKIQCRTASTSASN